MAMNPALILVRVEFKFFQLKLLYNNESSATFPHSVMKEVIKAFPLVVGLGDYFNCQ